jgi:hypothetical protein
LFKYKKSIKMQKITSIILLWVSLLSCCCNIAFASSSPQGTETVVLFEKDGFTVAGKDKLMSIIKERNHQDLSVFFKRAQAVILDKEAIEANFNMSISELSSSIEHDDEGIGFYNKLVDLILNTKNQDLIRFAAGLFFAYSYLSSDIVDREDNNLLHLACKHGGSKDEIEFFLSANQSIYHVNKKGQLPFFIDGSSTEYVKNITEDYLKFGSDSPPSDFSQDSIKKIIVSLDIDALAWIFLENKEDELKEALSSSFDFNPSTIEYKLPDELKGTTGSALHFLIYFTLLNCCEESDTLQYPSMGIFRLIFHNILVKNPAIINVPNSSGLTPLLFLKLCSKKYFSDSMYAEYSNEIKLLLEDQEKKSLLNIIPKNLSQTVSRSEVIEDNIYFRYFLELYPDSKKTIDPIYLTVFALSQGLIDESCVEVLVKTLAPDSSYLKELKDFIDSCFIHHPESLAKQQLLSAIEENEKSLLELCKEDHHKSKKKKKKKKKKKELTLGAGLQKKAVVESDLLDFKRQQETEEQLKQEIKEQRKIDLMIRGMWHIDRVCQNHFLRFAFSKLQTVSLQEEIHERESVQEQQEPVLLQGVSGQLQSLESGSLLYMQEHDLRVVVQPYIPMVGFNISVDPAFQAAEVRLFSYCFNRETGECSLWTPGGGLVTSWKVSPPSSQ